MDEPMSFRVWATESALHSGTAAVSTLPVPAWVIWTMFMLR